MAEYTSTEQPTSSGQHVLMKDQSRIKKAVRRTTIAVNSRDRNYLNYPNSNFFRYTLRRPLTNVLSIELTNGTIPSYIYNIQEEWGSFTFYEAAIPYVAPAISATITLTPGFYTDAELVTELGIQLNAIPGKKIHIRLPSMPPLQAGQRDTCRLRQLQIYMLKLHHMC